MKRGLVALIDQMRADLSAAAIAIERGDVEGAIAKFADIAESAEQKAQEMKAA